MTDTTTLSADERQMLAMLHVLNARYGPEPVMMAVALLNPLSSWPRRLGLLVPGSWWHVRCDELTTAAEALAEDGLIRKVRRERRERSWRAWDVYDVTAAGRAALAAEGHANA